MPLQVIETQRLYQKVAHQLREMIRAGEFRPGDRLPSERDLAKQLRISRPTVREAMIALELEGVIDIRVGAGIFVLAPGNLPGPSDLGPSPHDVLGARRLVEAEIAATAARLATPDHLSAIEAAFDDMAQDMGAGGYGLAGDRLFHVGIAVATGNGVLVSMVDGLWDGRESLIFRLLGDKARLSDAKAMTLTDHWRILGCLRRHDADAARTAMVEHIDHVRAVIDAPPELSDPAPSPEPSSKTAADAS